METTPKKRTTLFDPPGPDHNHKLTIEQVPIADIKEDARNPRTYKAADVDRTVGVLRRIKKEAPTFIGDDNTIIGNPLWYLAATALGRTHISVIRAVGMSPVEQRALSVAIDRVNESGTWSKNILTEVMAEFRLELPGFELMDVGWTAAEIDPLLGFGDSELRDNKLPPILASAISILGDVWLLGPHRVLCGDATKPESYDELLAERVISMVFCDPPYGCKINGNVSKRGRHREFPQGSEGVIDDKLVALFNASCTELRRHCRPEATAYFCIDWRAQFALQTVSTRIFGPVSNICIWAKDRPGMGSWYRSQYEMVLVHRLAGAASLNNIQLGRFGRNRSNLWEYPSALSAKGGPEGDMLKHHPTPKPVALVADAILDCTEHDEVVCDAFLGSGATLIAAEKTNRVCCGMELDAVYVDLAVRRWEKFTGKKAVHAVTGKTFDEVAAERQMEGQNG